MAFVSRGICLSLVLVLFGTVFVPLSEGTLNGVVTQECYPIFEATPGNAGWYISPVQVTFIFDPVNVTTIEYLWNGTWVLYTGPFNMTKYNESPLFQWRYKTIHSGESWLYDQCTVPSFWIDVDKPSVNITVRKKGFLWWRRLIITVTATDPTSGMSNVQLCINNAMWMNDTDGTDGWVFILHPIPRHESLHFSVYAYDIAGNCGENNATVTNCYPLGP
jgi:hypothetical protein